MTDITNQLFVIVIVLSVCVYAYHFTRAIDLALFINYGCVIVDKIFEKKKWNNDSNNNKQKHYPQLFCFDSGSKHQSTAPVDYLDAFSHPQTCLPIQTSKQTNVDKFLSNAKRSGETKQMFVFSFYLKSNACIVCSVWNEIIQDSWNFPVALDSSIMYACIVPDDKNRFYSSSETDSTNNLFSTSFESYRTDRLNFSRGWEQSIVSIHR